MRVLFVTRWYPNPAHPNAGVFIREHAKAARAAGVDVTVLHVPGQSGPVSGLWRLDHEPDLALTEGIPTYRIATRAVSAPMPHRVGRAVSYSIYLWGIIRGFGRLLPAGERFDLIDAQVWNSGVPATLLGRLHSIPVVVTEHSSAFPRHELSSRQLARARSVMRRADRVLPVSTSLKEAIRSEGIEARFEVVPNAVDLALFHPPAAGASGTDSEGRKRMIFVGNLEATGVKGFPTLIEALKLLAAGRSDWVLDVVGDGPSRREYQGRVEAEGLGGRVSFRGGVPKAMVAEMMRSSYLFVMPSNFETQGAAILEAMSSGLPIVATEVGGIPESVSEKDGLLVPPRDPAALAVALDRVLSEPGLFDRGDIARRAAARFGLASIGSRLAQVYAEVVEERRHPGGA
jgi:glycosyltransferase involved in cell wall biosynthesis